MHSFNLRRKFAVYLFNLIPYIKENLCNKRVEVPVRALPYNFKAPVKRHSVTVAALFGNCVKNVGNRHYPCTKGNVLTDKPVRIALSVPFLVVIAGNLKCQFAIFLVTQITEGFSNNISAVFCVKDIMI